MDIFEIKQILWSNSYINEAVKKYSTSSYGIFFVNREPRVERKADGRRQTGFLRDGNREPRTEKLSSEGFNFGNYMNPTDVFSRQGINYLL